MMTEIDRTRLEEDLAMLGLQVGLPPCDGISLHDRIADANEWPKEEALERLAHAFGIIPFAPSRIGCSTRAESALRSLASRREEDDSWLPVGTLGPLLICAHYNPSSRGSWGIPGYFVIPTLVSEEKYVALRKDIETRLSLKPLDPVLRIVPSCPPPKEENLLPTLDWLITEYPFDEETMTKLRTAREELNGMEPRTFADLKILPRNFGLAVQHLATGDYCFNAEHTSPQHLFSEALLEKHAVYPLFCGKKVIYLLSSTREVYSFEDEWLSAGNETVQMRVVLSERESILNALNRERSRAVQGAVATPTGDLTYSDGANIVDIDVRDIQRINPSSINTTPEQVVQWVLYRAITGRASDLHIEKYFNTARFRARIDGELKVIHSCPEEMLARFVSLIKNYANMGQRRQDAQDARFSLLLGKRRVDCRVSAIPCRKDLQKITIRFLDKDDGLKSMGDLNLSPRQLSLLGEAMGRDQGMILVTGPTGSGKTTTLYALLNSINADNINIHTIEDPIEYEVEGLNQTQTDPINNINFLEGLRRLMRADPDVILIGECRDEETATAAINAALTGHLVLTTLHANDCLRAVSRLISMGVPPYLLADALALTQAQRLVRRLCPYCKSPVMITREIRTIFGANRVHLPDDAKFLYTKSGCPECHDIGYSGRIALMEMTRIDTELSDLIATNAPQSMMRKYATSKGVLSLYQEGLQQVLAGNTSLEEISCLSYTAKALDADDVPASDDDSDDNLARDVQLYAGQ